MSDFLYNQYNSAQKETLENKEKEKEFLKRIEPFKNVSTLEEAKELAKKILPVKEDITGFSVGNISCKIVNNENLFRISINTADEFICYDFS